MAQQVVLVGYLLAIAAGIYLIYYITKAVYSKKSMKAAEWKKKKSTIFIILSVAIYAEFFSWFDWYTEGYSFLISFLAALPSAAAWAIIAFWLRMWYLTKKKG